MTVIEVPKSPPGGQTFAGHRGRIQRRTKSTDCKRSQSQGLETSRPFNQTTTVQQPISASTGPISQSSGPISPSSKLHFQRRRPAPCEASRRTQSCQPGGRATSRSSTISPTAAYGRVSPVMRSAGRAITSKSFSKTFGDLTSTGSDSVDANTTLTTTASTPSSCSGTPTPPACPSVKRRRSFRQGFSLGSDEADKCSCCTKEDFWPLFDTFQDMDRHQSGVIGRRDFVWALRALGAGIDFHKAANKAKLAAHFHKSARDLPLEGFIRRAFPNCVDADVTRMLRWADLRRAHTMLMSEKFKGTESELRQVFSFLDEDGSGEVPLREVVRAKILSHEEATTLLPKQWSLSPLGFEAFCGVVLKKFWNRDEVALEEGDVSQDPDESWRRAVHIKFLQTRDAILQQSADNKESLSLSWQPIVLSTAQDDHQSESRSCERASEESIVQVPVPPSGQRSPNGRPRRTIQATCRQEAVLANGAQGPALRDENSSPNVDGL